MVQVKPWYESLASWGNLIQWIILLVVIGVLSYASAIGVDIAALTDKYLGHVLIASTVVAKLIALVMSTIGTMTRTKEIDAAQIAPGVRWEAFGKVIDNIKANRKQT
jgi:hypothetical protein